MGAQISVPFDLNSFLILLLACLMSDLSSSSISNSQPPEPALHSSEQTGLEPELGGHWRNAPDRTGLEPELGGAIRQKGVYVDEVVCIGCKHCSHVARNTFYIEPDYGRARVVRQDADPQDLVQEAIETCPVNCIQWVDYTDLKRLEEERKYQVIPLPGGLGDRATYRLRRKQKFQRQQRPKP